MLDGSEDKYGDGDDALLKIVVITVLEPREEYLISLCGIIGFLLKYTAVVPYLIGLNQTLKKKQSRDMKKLMDLTKCLALLRQNFFLLCG